MGNSGDSLRGRSGDERAGLPALTQIWRRARRELGKVPIVRRLRDDADLVLKYGRLRPERVPLARSPHAIFVDPREPRGRAILRSYGSGQGALKSVWRNAIANLRPTIVVDVGANYGEFLFSTDYAEGTVVIGVEADPHLCDYLRRSREIHPQRSQIEIVCALACEAPGREQPFYVDTDWSGRSSALQQERHRNTRTEMVPTTSVDALVASRSQASDRLLFKIDVEGFEPRVLAGMEKTLATVSSSVGILEFNTHFLRKLGVDPSSYLNRLLTRFHVRLFAGVDAPEPITPTTVSKLIETHHVADLVLATEPGILAAITDSK